METETKVEAKEHYLHVFLFFFFFFFSNDNCNRKWACSQSVKMSDYDLFSKYFFKKSAVLWCFDLLNQKYCLCFRC